MIERGLTDEELATAYAAQDHPDTTTLNEYECEVCGKKATLTEQDAYLAGWDYPPFVGLWGVVSPRTCGDCGIDQTAYWHLITLGGDDIPEKHMVTIKRILAERLPATPTSTD